jgi:D-alanyl-D-alanine dipeptidase
MMRISLIALLVLCTFFKCRDNAESVVTDAAVVQDTVAKSAIELKMEAIGLVDIETLTDDIPVSLMYARDDNFTGKVMYHDLTRAYLHPEAARALLKAQAALKRIRPDLSLKVYDAARPMSVQQIMWDAVKDTDKQIYVSNPARGGGLHNYGLAVDVTLCDVATGDTLTMGTHIDYFGKRAQVRHEATFIADGSLSREAYENRLLLRNVMTSAGYKVLLSEWWHFNFKTRDEAKANYTVIP